MFLSGCGRPLVERCAEAFPSTTDTIATERIVVDSIVIPGSTLVVVDSVECPPGLSEPLYVKDTVLVRLPAKTIVREVLATDTVILHADAGLVKGLQGEIEKLQHRVALERESKKNYRNLIYIIIGLSIVSAGLVVYLKRGL